MLRNPSVFKYTKQSDATDVTEHTESHLQVETGSPHQQYLNYTPFPLL